MTEAHHFARLAGAFILAASVFAVAPVAFATDPPMPAVLGTPGVVGKGPVIDGFSFEGNHKVSGQALAAVVDLPAGTPLSAFVIQPQLEKIAAYYRAYGGAYVQPSILETRLNHVRVIFQVHEGAAPRELPEEAPAPAFLDKFFGNTLICAATQTGNDLCHMWLERDGSFIIFDPTGAHSGHWKTGVVRTDGRVPLCRYWDLSDFKAPAELGIAPLMAQAKPRPGVPTPAMLCTTTNFRTSCVRYPDRSKLTPEQQRLASRTMLQTRHDDGICYAHGPHEVGAVWFEWDDPLPGQLGLDREMLLPGHQ